MSFAADLLLSAEEWPPPLDDRRPVGFIDMGRWPLFSVPEPLPAFPLIGLGDPAHPLASALDAVVEPPTSAEAVVRAVLRSPRAASVAVHLLRSVRSLPVAEALSIESLCYGLLQGSAEHAAWLANRPFQASAPPGRVHSTRSEHRMDVTIDRPAALNAIDRKIRDELFEAFTVAELDPEIRLITLRSTGPAFSIGGDLSEFGSTRDPAEAHIIRSRTLPALPLSRCAHKAAVHVHGACVGAGIELAAFAARVTASSSAWFQLPELAMGLVPGAGGCVSLPRRIGRQRTALMILSGRRIGAGKALEWGLIDAIEDDPLVDDRRANRD